MGVSLGSSWSCGSAALVKEASSKMEWLPNPDAKNFILKEGLEIGRYLIVRVHYPNCINFEGNKIMIYRGITLKQFKGWKEVDPHFKNHDLTSPIARFEPTFEGWNDAINFANMKVKLDNTL